MIAHFLDFVNPFEKQPKLKNNGFLAVVFTKIYYYFFTFFLATFLDLVTGNSFTIFLTLGIATIGCG